jgi:hypothetical protein
VITPDLCQICFESTCDGELERHPAVLESDELFDLAASDERIERRTVWVAELRRRGAVTS